MARRFCIVCVECDQTLAFDFARNRYADCGCKRPRSVRSEKRRAKFAAPTAGIPRNRAFAERTAAGRKSAEAWKRAYRLGQTRCHYCDALFTDEKPPTFDHIVPRSEGGTRLDGVVLACGKCNGSRGSLPYEVFVRQRRES